MKKKLGVFTILFFAFTRCGADESIENNSSLDAITTQQTMRYPVVSKNQPIIIDAYGPNRQDYNLLGPMTQNNFGLTAIIHKATDGSSTDAKYFANKSKAQNLGYLWGSYHLARKGNGKTQAIHYLNFLTKSNVERNPQAVNSIQKEFIALDMEDVGGVWMDVPNTILFLETIFKYTGRYPVLYANQNAAQKLARQANTYPVLKKLPLWYARFKSPVTPRDMGTVLNAWQTVTLWQFASEINCPSQTAYNARKCPYYLPGVNRDMDFNIFNGTKEELIANWPLTHAQDQRPPDVIQTPPTTDPIIIKFQDGFPANRSKKQLVKNIQALLAQFYDITVDGLYGNGTASIIQQFQFDYQTELELSDSEINGKVFTEKMYNLLRSL